MIAGKQVVVVDDSIVRGNTQRAIVAMLREAGAAEVHVRISCPPVTWPCFYGIDFASRAELIAGGLSVEEIRASIGADSLGYVSLEGLIAATPLPAGRLCRACFDGDYPVRLPPRSAASMCSRRAVRDADAGGKAATRAHTGRSVAGARATRGRGRHRGRRRAVDLMRAAVARTAGPRSSAASAASPGSSTRPGSPLPAAAAGDRDRRRRHQGGDRAAVGVYDTVGIDLVAMVVDDLVVCGAEPLFMTDYVVCGRVLPERVAAIVDGVAEGCVQAGCALIGGETAEHPGQLGPDDFDLAGAATGVVEADELLGPDRVRPGDAVIAMASSGLHSNGYSLVRQVCRERAGGLRPGATPPELGPHARRGAARPDPDLRRDAWRWPPASARLRARDRRRAGANLARVMPPEPTPPSSAAPGPAPVFGLLAGHGTVAARRWSGSSTWASGWSPWSARRRRRRSACSPPRRARMAARRDNRRHGHRAALGTASRLTPRDPGSSRCRA